MVSMKVDDLDVMWEYCQDSLMVALKVRLTACEMGIQLVFSTVD